MSTPEPIWPEELSETDGYALEALVHDQASQLASNVVNAGTKDMRDYLLANGWSVAEILDRLGRGPE